MVFLPPVLVAGFQCLSAVWMIQGKRSGLKLALVIGVISAITGCGWGQFGFNGLELFRYGVGSAFALGIAVYAFLRFCCSFGPRLAGRVQNDGD